MKITTKSKILTMVASLAVLGMMYCQEGECTQAPKPTYDQHYSKQTRTFAQIPFAIKTDGSVLTSYEKAKSDLEIKRDYQDELDLYERMRNCGVDIARKEYESYLPGDIGNTLDYLKMLRMLTVKSYSEGQDEKFEEYVKEMEKIVFPGENNNNNNNVNQRQPNMKGLARARNALSTTLLANKSKIYSLTATKNWIEKSLVNEGMTLVRDMAEKLSEAGAELTKEEVDRETLNQEIRNCDEKLQEAIQKKEEMGQRIRQWDVAVGDSEGTKLKESLVRISETLESLKKLTVNILKKLTDMLKKYDELMGAYYDTRGDMANYVPPQILTDALNETAPGVKDEVDKWRNANVKNKRYKLDLGSTDTKYDDGGYNVGLANEKENRKEKMTASITADADN